MGKIILTLAIAFALAVPNVTFADQKKPAPKPTKGEEWPTENVGLNYGKIEYSKKAPTSTGPIKPTLPTTGGRHR